jgi:uncharacterized protein (TIGR02328 family)
MRIWDYRLIEVLPNAQLKAMRYEISDMVKQYPNIKNRLVSYANNYAIVYLLSYFYQVTNEMEKRNIKMNDTYNSEIVDICFQKSKSENIFFDFNKPPIYPEHNDRYLRQCLFNLEEKFDRKIITEEEWQKIYNKFKDFTDLWEGEYHE